MTLPAYIAFVTDYRAVPATDKKNAKHKADLLLIEYFDANLYDMGVTDEEIEKAQSDPALAGEIVQMLFDYGWVQVHGLTYGFLPLVNA